MTEKELQKKKMEYIQQEKFFEKWRPSDIGPDQKLPSWVPKWRAKKIEELWSNFNRLYGQKEEDMAKVIDINRPKLVDIQTMDVTLKRDIKVGLPVGLGDDVQVEGSIKVKKGTRVQIKFSGLRFLGLFIRVRVHGVKGPSAYFFIDDKCSVEYALKKYFEPLTEAWDVCSIIPAGIKDEMRKMKIKVYKTESKERKEYAKLLNKLLLKSA